MNPTNFPEANAVFGTPKDLAPSQCRAIPAFRGTVDGGSVDGLVFVVVAWQPTPEEIEDIKNGKPVFISMVGGLAPHYLTTDFFAATHPR